jgi:hypothetical protein
MNRAVRHAVGLSLLLVISLPNHATAQAAPRGRAAIRGSVTDTAGHPLAGALIVRSGSADSARTDAQGRFAVEGLAAGHYLFRVRHPGHATVEMEVTFPADTGTASVEIPMEAAASDAAVNAKLEQVGFVERHRRIDATRERVTFLGPEDIAGRGAVHVSQLFGQLPDITTRFERDITVVYGNSGQCVMNVWLDGRMVDNVFPPLGSSGSSATTVRYVGLDELLQLDQVAAVEIYPRPANTPPQFQRTTVPFVVAPGGSAGARSFRGSASGISTRSAECGSIVIWSR